MKYLVSFVIAALVVSTTLAASPTTLYTSADCSGPTYMPPPWGQPPIQMLRIGSISDGGKCTTWPPRPMLVGVPPAKSPTDLSGNNPAATESFQQGVADRAAMEKWTAGLTGDYKRGVDWWAEHRSAANPGPCRGREATSFEFISGCEAASARLAPVDVKRKSDPEYRRGWNTYNDAPTTQPFAAGPPVPPVNQVGGSDRNDPQLPRNFSSVSSGADSAATGEHPSMGSLAAEENIQPTGQYEGSYKVPGVEAKVVLLAGHSHAAIIVEYRERAGTPSMTYSYCQYLFESKTAHTGDLVTNFGTNRPPSSPTCPKLLTVNLRPDRQHPNISLELGATTIRTSLSSTNLGMGPIPSTTPDNVETGGLKLSNTFREIQEHLRANGFVIEAHDSMTPSGTNAYKTILAYKSIALAELKQYCSQTSASGIAAREIIALQFPYSANMDGLYPIAIKRVINFPPGEEILALEVEDQVSKKYGPATVREANTRTWNYDKDGNVFAARTVRDDRNILKMQLYSKAEVIEGPPNRCQQPGLRVTFDGNFVNYSCSTAKNSDTVKADLSRNGYTVSISNDPRCAFSLDTSVSVRQDKVEQFSAVILSQRNAVNALNDIEANELDLSISKTLADIKKSRGKDFKP
jgi:hypothetical protein